MMANRMEELNISGLIFPATDLGEGGVPLWPTAPRVALQGGLVDLSQQKEDLPRHEKRCLTSELFPGCVKLLTDH